MQIHHTDCPAFLFSRQPGSIGFIKNPGGTWLDQLVERATLVLGVMGFSPILGLEVT